MDATRTLAELEDKLVPLERFEKPGWDQVTAAEKEIRQARSEVLARIVSHRWQRPIGRKAQHA